MGTWPNCSQEDLRKAFLGDSKQPLLCLLGVLLLPWSQTKGTPPAVTAEPRGAEKQVRALRTSLSPWTPFDLRK